jgi:hypothetical protein
VVWVGLDWCWWVVVHGSEEDGDFSLGCFGIWDEFSFLSEYGMTIIMVGTVDMYKLHLLGVSENGSGTACKSQIRDCYANYTSTILKVPIPSTQGHVSIPRLDHRFISHKSINQAFLVAAVVRSPFATHRRHVRTRDSP